MPLVMGHFGQLDDLVSKISSATTAIDSSVTTYQSQATATGLTWTDIAGDNYAEFNAAYKQYHTASQHMIAALGGGVSTANIALQDAANASAAQVRQVSI